MTERARAHVTPEVLLWAREAVALNVETAARRAGVTPEKLSLAEQGEHLLTIRQARSAARAYRRSLAFLMRSSPPEEPSLESKFRRLRGAPAPPWSSELIQLEREIMERQEATVDLYEAMGDQPPWPEAAARLGLPKDVPSAEMVRAVLSHDPAERRGLDYCGR